MALASRPTKSKIDYDTDRDNTDVAPHRVWNADPEGPVACSKIQMMHKFANEIIHQCVMILALGKLLLACIKRTYLLLGLRTSRTVTIPFKSAFSLHRNTTRCDINKCEECIWTTRGDSYPWPTQHHSGYYLQYTSNISVLLTIYAPHHIWNADPEIAVA